MWRERGGEETRRHKVRRREVKKGDRIRESKRVRQRDKREREE